MNARRGLRAGGAFVVASLVACNAILGIDGAPLVDAGKGTHPGDARSDAAGSDATTQGHGDAATDATVGADAPDAARPTDAGVAGDVVDATRAIDVGAATDAFSCGDVYRSDAPRDALSEGAPASDPGSTVCNTSLAKDDGGTCNTSTSFCCNFNGVGGATRPDAETRCLANSELSHCARIQSPTTCDESADCAPGSVCCLGAPSTVSVTNIKFVQMCAPRGDSGAAGGACANLPEVVSALADAAVTVAPFAQICKHSSECAPCETCTLWCCAGDQLEIAACTSPLGPMLSAFCTRGPCAADAGNGLFSNDDIQDHGETDVDCGGRFLPDGGPNPASDEARPCANGYKCASGRDCMSGSCEAGVCVPPGDH